MPGFEVYVITGGESNMNDTVDSTSDERTINNVMRHGYKVLTDLEKEEMLAVKDAGLNFYNLIEKITLKSGGGTRELALAKTKIEEAVMWSCKHITG